ncbi:MAG: recombinase family protein [Bacteriovoracaceae bacterium]|nr:recombinase family protein [Bacteriovoracaceae bacterium]
MNELGVNFTSLSEKVDSNTAIGKAMFVITSAISALERDLFSERTIIGLKNARTKGKSLGRPRTRNSQLIRELNFRGYSHREIAQLAGCSKTTVWRELKDGPKNKR